MDIRIEKSTKLADAGLPYKVFADDEFMGQHRSPNPAIDHACEVLRANLIDSLVKEVNN